MTTPTSGLDLLGFADDVLHTAAPRPAALRRAVSAAYYTVFHELVRAAVRRSVGDHPVHHIDRHVAYRWYTHSDLRVVSKWVLAAAGRGKLPEQASSLLASPPPDLVILANRVGQLQKARITADYEYAEDVTIEDVRASVDKARSALDSLARLAGDRVAENYLTLLLGGPRLPAR
jgi:hypothetical protein